MCCISWGLSESNDNHIDTENHLMAARGEEVSRRKEMGGRNKEEQASSYKINNSWVCNL